MYYRKIGMNVFFAYRKQKKEKIGQCNLSKTRLQDSANVCPGGRKRINQKFPYAVEVQI